MRNPPRSYTEQVSFFELPPRPEPPHEPEPAPLPWHGPPENALGGSVPLELLVGRSETAAVAFTNVTAYPSGFGFTLAVRLREPSTEPCYHRPPHELWSGEGAGDLPDRLLRFGFDLADGSKATSVGGFPLIGDEPAGPVLIGGAGGGGARSWDQRFWVWPLPPPGRMAAVCEWPSEGIALTRVELDAAPIREAADRAVVLWEGPGTLRGGWTATGTASFRPRSG